MPHPELCRSTYWIWGLSALAAIAVYTAGSGLALSDEPAAVPDRAGVQFFESKIRPLLVDQCQQCHGEEKQKGGLRVDSLASLVAGGDSGSALAAGEPDQSLLIEAVSYENPNLQMPPKKKLSDQQIADLKQWVAIGAPWPPGDEPGKVARRGAKEITDEDRAYWAFRPVARPARPEVKRAADVANGIDALILARLEAKGLVPNALADRRTLIRRAYFDLIGLPPAPEEVERFAADESPTAWNDLIDRLLAMPQYGERWGRHWLDVVRFAQTNGYERDSEKPLAWKYRDYVIRALNDDKPFNQFVIEQLAGDELEPFSADAAIATGFYRLSVWDDEPDDGRMAEFDQLDDIVSTTGAAFLGLTVGCARCHDHMFDPVPQADYYRLLAFFRNVRGYGYSGETLESPTLMPLVDRATRKAWRDEQQAAIAPLEKKLRSLEGPVAGEGLSDEDRAKQNKERDAERDRLRKEIERIRNRRPEAEFALAIRERGPQAPPTNILIRGNAATPGPEVQPAFLSVLGGASPVVSERTADSDTTGLRLAFARWVASDEQPLTPRVIVNRLWQHHFGQGLVKTTNDFGKSGTPPTHPELVDWLAAELIEKGWSLKALHKTIMLSNAYQRSAHNAGNPAAEVDPGNDLLWRQNLRRLDAEAIRDAVLAISGTLNPAMGGRGFFPHLGGEVLAGSSRPGAGWDRSPESEQQRRSVYAFIKRSMVIPFFEAFDYANVNTPLGERPTTTVAPQALMLLNDDFLQKQARAMAARLVKETGSETDTRALVDRAYRLATGRGATDREVALAQEFLDRQARENRPLKNRITFKPDVPFTLNQGYLGRLKPTEMLHGPEEGWSYHKGNWVGGYEGLVVVERGPYALWQGARFVDGSVSGRVVLHQAAEFARLIVRADNVGEVFHGYDVSFDPRAQKVQISRHAKDVRLLGEQRANVPTGKPVAFRVELNGPELKLWYGAVDGEPLLAVTDPEPLLGAGAVGFRAWGAGASVDDLTVSTGGQTWNVAETPVPTPRELQPLADFTYFGGDWKPADGGAYEVQPDPGAKIVWKGSKLDSGTVHAAISLRSDGGDAGLLVRVSEPQNGTDSLRAYNINLALGHLKLGKHENNWQELKVVPVQLEKDRWQTLRVELEGARIRVWLNEAADPQIDVVDPNPLPAGEVGFRTFNARAAIRDLKLVAGEKEQVARLVPEPTAVKPAAAASDADAWARRRALESLCLLVLNLNEMVYVD